MQRFLNRERLTVLPSNFRCPYMAIYGCMILFGSGSLDYFRKPIGSDFVAFWAASQMILSGQAAEIYHHEKLFQVEERIAGKRYPLPISYPRLRFCSWRFSHSFHTCLHLSSGSQ